VSQPPFSLYIVDDDEDDLLFIHNAFREIGLDNVCKGFLNGHEFLQHMRLLSPAEIPDVIVLDFEMPRMNGKELLKQIRTIPIASGIPVIFYSDKITPELEQELLAQGAYCCIKKGVTSRDQVKFAKTITELLNKRLS
jgi:CheY-like chemotaxis protein